MRLELKMTKHSFAIIAFLSLILLFSPVTMNGANAQQPQNQIPDWVKTTAGWWADGAIDGTSFAQGIQYLIKEDIIIIPETTQGTSSGTNEIPDWVKNNAGWWADGSIDESSFVSSMQFLIEEGVVQISSTENSTPQDPVITEQLSTPQDPVITEQLSAPQDPVIAEQESSPQDLVITEQLLSPQIITLEKINAAKKNSQPNNNQNTITISKFEIISSPDNLIDKVKKNGKVKVIVELNIDYDPNLSKEKKVNQRANIKAAQNSLMNTLSSDGISSFRNFKETPQIAMTVDTNSLDQLFSSGLVKTIQEDKIHTSQLELSITDREFAIKADNFFGLGLVGSGQTVAILDTGVDKTHNFFKLGGSVNRIVSEACFTGTPTIDQASAYAPCSVDPLLNELVGPDSGLPCIIAAGCDHGTHVAGIAAGKNTAAGDPTSGVAKGADIIAIQIFTIFEGTKKSHVCPGGNPAFPVYCALAFTSDIMSGLQHVLQLHNGEFGFTGDISSVNLSLGGSPFGEVCDMVNDGFGNLVAHPVKASIDALRTAGIATIISAGNDEGNNVITTPACISSAISVSSIDDFGDFPDYANQASFLDFLAPGGNFLSTGDSAINSSILGNNFGLKIGTSMAAPHVTGAWALLRAANVTASIDDIFSALSDSGTLLTLRNTANGAKPLIQLDQALAKIIINTCNRDILNATMGNFDAIISGTSGDDIIAGTPGDDLILGFGGNDHIQGYDGNDCIIGGDGNDTISGGKGNDHIEGNDGNDHLNGGDGNDFIDGGNGDDTLSGGFGNDELRGGDGNDSLKGDEDDDALFGGDDNDILSGGDGNEKTTVLPSGVTAGLFGGDGDDILLGRGGDDHMVGGNGLDACYGESGADTQDGTCEIFVQ